MELTGKNIIGQNLSGSGAAFQAVNPATGKKIAPDFREATGDEIDKAIEMAHAAFDEYRTKSGNLKALFLEAIAEEILALGDGLIHRCMEETGLPEARLTGERGRTVGQLRLFAAHLREGSWVNARIDTADPDRKPLPKPDVRSMLRPLGAVGVFGASNFPLAFSVAGGDTVSALAAGCTVVVKGHPAHPGTSELVGMAIQRAVRKSGMPPGVFSMVQGHAVEVGLRIVRHPLIQAVGFTGSFRGGKSLFDEACRRPVPIPVYAEMGSVNPVFILPEALKSRKESIARDLAASVTQGVGQFCTNPGLVVVEQSADQKDFVQHLARGIGETSAGVMLSEGIHRNFEHGLQRLRAIEGVGVRAECGKTGDGYRGAPALLEAEGKLFLREPQLQEEVFGPSTLMITANTRKELLDVARKLEGHLTATLHGTDQDLQDFADLVAVLETKVGRLIVNGYPTGVEVCHSMVHGGPFPATTDSRSTSVGTTAINRFARPVCYQNFPSFLLPDELRDGNPLGIWRLLNAEWKKE